MFLKTSLVFLAAGLQTISAAALPAMAPRDDTQCAPGSNFYVCNLNNFRGCCSVDPCALEAGCPDSNQGNCGADGVNRIYNPGMRIVGKDGPQPNDFHVKRTDASVQDQNMYFSLPPFAKNCRLRWGVPGEADREFRVEGNGLVDVNLVGKNGTPAKDVGGADFTNWDKSPKPQDGHIVGSFDCTTDPIFRISLRENGEVYIDQNDHTGWYVEYDC